jgi:endonuclease YncB( thermonuclease family)
MPSRRRVTLRTVLRAAVAAVLAALLAAWWLTAPPPEERQAPLPQRPSPGQARGPWSVPPAGSVQAPRGYRTLALPEPPRSVHDGDTFSADLDGDGTLARNEHVRLLFVDTPELGESWKGKDREHGEPARDFLAGLLQHPPVILFVPLDRPTDRYGRTLARVQAGGQDVDLALIRAGHSPYDTRFGFAPDADHDAYSAAEGEAFDAQRGIWAEADSRQRYLERLQREHKTPAGRSNPRYVPGVLAARQFRPAAWLGRYVTVEGTVLSVRELGKGVRLLRLRAAPGEPPLAVVAFRGTAGRLGLERWARGGRVRVQGFVQTYKGRLELLLHHGRALP